MCHTYFFFQYFRSTSNDYFMLPRISVYLRDSNFFFLFTKNRRNSCQKEKYLEGSFRPQLFVELCCTKKYCQANNTPELLRKVNWIDFTYRKCPCLFIRKSG